MKSQIIKVTFYFLITTIFFSSAVNGQSNVVEYDIVIIGGRVIDPETKLDTIKNVGIIQNRIAQISSEAKIMSASAIL
jgi:dihydroorotase